MTHEKQQIKIGVHKGGGSPPVYQWTVIILDVAFEEAMDCLKPNEYEHMAMQVKELAREITPSHSSTCSVDAIEDFYELKDSGSALGGKNVRVFFGLDTSPEKHHLLVLGVIIKQNNGPTPQGDKIRIRRRWRKYKAGEYSQ